MPTPADPEALEAFRAATQDFPSEYDQKRRHERRTPPIVNDDSIILAHSLVPSVMKHMFQGLRGMFDPALPLTRRQQEMIGTTVSTLNSCFY